MNAVHVQENAPAYAALHQHLAGAFRDIDMPPSKRAAIAAVIDCMARGAAPLMSDQIAAGIPEDDQIVWRSQDSRFIFTRRELDQAFSRIKNPANWKDPIDYVMTLTAQPRAREAILAAIDFFVGGGGKIETISAPSGDQRAIRRPGLQRNRSHHRARVLRADRSINMGWARAYWCDWYFTDRLIFRHRNAWPCEGAD